MKAQVTFILILLFALITAVFAVINVEQVKVHLLFTETTIPLILIILSSTLLGGLIVGLIGISKQFRLKRTIKLLEKQLSDLKNTPVLSPSGISGSDATAADMSARSNIETKS